MQWFTLSWILFFHHNLLFRTFSLTPKCTSTQYNFRNKCGRQGMGGGNPTQKWEYSTLRMQPNVCSVLSPFGLGYPTHMEMTTFVLVLIIFRVFLLFISLFIWDEKMLWKFMICWKNSDEIFGHTDRILKCLRNKKISILYAKNVSVYTQNGPV